MRLFTAAEAAAASGGRLVRGTGGEEIARVVVDSRAAGPGDLFVAVPGERVDGHAFVGEALARGAVAALVSRLPEAAGPPPGALILVDDTVAALGRLAAYHRERFAVEVVGVTGSVGKTTTKELAAAVLGQRYRVLRSPGNYNTEIGLPLALLDLRPGHQVAVLEMGMRGPGQIRYLARLARPRAGILTLIAETHAELLGSVEAVARAKRELVEELPPGGVAVLNADDPRQRPMAAATRARVIWYGLGGGADVTAADLVPRGSGVRFTLRAPRLAAGEAPVDLPLPGRHHVADALAAAAVGLAFGLGLEEIARGLASASLPEMRSRIVEAGSLKLIDDTYNASPASVKAALETLAQVAPGRRVAVLGDMLELGDYSLEGHREVGRAAAQVDLLVTVGTRARHARDAAVEAGLPPERALHCADRDEALERLKGLLRPGDTVLVKGSRAMRMEEIVSGLQAWAAGAGRAGEGDRHERP